MLEKGRTGNWQLYLLVLFIILPTAILFAPSVTTSPAKEGAWAATLLAGVFALAMRNFTGRTVPVYFSIFELGLPLIILLIAVLRKRGRGADAKGKSV